MPDLQFATDIIGQEAGSLRSPGGFFYFNRLNFADIEQKLLKRQKCF